MSIKETERERVCVCIDRVNMVLCVLPCSLHTLDKTAPNVAFEYGGDRNGDDSLKELEVEEKQQLFDETITAPLTRSLQLSCGSLVTLTCIYTQINVHVFFFKIFSVLYIL